MIKDIFRGVAVLLAGVILATAAMIAACALPYDRVLVNIQSAADVLTEEDYGMQLAPGSRASELDNFTDALMMSTAAYSSGTVLERALLGRSYYWNGAIGGLTSQAYVDAAGAATATYSRYWHGYVVLLKPLLMLFDYSQIRMLNAACQLLLAAAVLMLLARRSGTVWYALPVLAAYIGLYPPAVSMCLQYSAPYYVAFLAALVLLWRYGRLTLCQTRMLFLVTGMCTSFFDMMTYPLLTWALPMGLYIALLEKWDKKAVLELAVLSLFWCAGYGGQWAGKWIVGTLLTGSDVFSNAFGAVDTLTADRSFGTVLGLQAGTLFSNTGFVLVLAAAAIMCLARLVRAGRPDRGDVAAAVFLGAVALSPFVWYKVASTFAYIHYWFAYRTMVIAFFALLCLLVRLGRRPKTPAPET